VKTAFVNSIVITRLKSEAGLLKFPALPPPEGSSLVTSITIPSRISISESIKSPKFGAAKAYFETKSSAINSSI
jgi:hypothetical protein